MIDYQKPAIGEEKSAIDDKKSAVDRIKSAIEQQKYNEPSKANILKVYDEIEKNQIFGTKEIKEILDQYANEIAYVSLLIPASIMFDKTCMKPRSHILKDSRLLTVKVVLFIGQP